MSCADAEILLTGLVDGELDEAQTRQVEDHVRACEGCRRLVDEERGLKTALGRMPIPEPPPELGVKLRALVAGRGRVARVQRVVRFTAAAAAVLAVAGIVIFVQLAGPSPAAEASVRELLRMHEESQSSAARYCACCKNLSSALERHMAGRDLLLPANLRFKGYLTQESPVLLGKVPCFVSQTSSGSVSMFVFDDLPLLPDGDQGPKLETGTCFTLETPEGALVVVCSSAGHQVWVGKMRADQLADVVLAR